MERARMTIEIEFGSTPITGSLYDSQGVAHAFCGWMNFASLLQAAIEQANKQRASYRRARSALREEI
jgi:hypothetical protein